MLESLFPSQQAGSKVDARSPAGLRADPFSLVSFLPRFEEVPRPVQVVV